MKGRLALAGLLLAGACNDNALFTVGRDLDVCDGAFPSCMGSAHCVLDTEHYVHGTFPGGQRLIVRAQSGDTMDFKFWLSEEKAPGTALVVTVYEPGCGDHRIYDTSGRDLFRVAGDDGILDLPFVAAEAGDHLMEIQSDAFCTWDLIWDEVMPSQSALSRPTPLSGRAVPWSPTPAAETALFRPIPPGEKGALSRPTPGGNPPTLESLPPTPRL